MIINLSATTSSRPATTGAGQVVAALHRGFNQLPNGPERDHLRCMSSPPQAEWDRDADEITTLVALARRLAHEPSGWAKPDAM